MPRHFLFTPDILGPVGGVDCLILAAQGSKIQDYSWISEPVRAQIRKVLELECTTSSPALGMAVTIYPEASSPFKRVLAVQVGDGPLTEHQKISKWVKACFDHLPRQKLDKVLITLPFEGINPEHASRYFERIVIYFDARTAPQTCFQTCQDGSDCETKIDAIYFASNLLPATTQEILLKQSEAVAKGIHRCTRVANLPANYCTPHHLRQEAQDLVEQFPGQLTLTVHDEAAIKQMKMGGLLGVSAGSQYPPYLFEVHYSGDEATAAAGATKPSPIVFVGKGITFDSGGISIKPSAKMGRMKFDMCGAAAVLGILEALCHLKLRIPVVGLMAVAENMPDGGAYRPGDVLTMYSGVTVEVVNTDAEGRLILADALAYAEKHLNPRMIIDMATLTGACVVALGKLRSGCYFHDPAHPSDLFFESQYFHALCTSAEEAGDHVWPMPLDAAYDASFKSDIADWTNCGEGGEGGSIVAARFLSKFVTKTPWAHLDIAGTAYMDSESHGNKATGRPIPAMVKYLINLGC